MSDYKKERKVFIDELEAGDFGEISSGDYDVDSSDTLEAFSDFLKSEPARIFMSNALPETSKSDKEF